MPMESELLERVEKWARESPTRTMLSFVDDRGSVTASLTAGELYRKMQNLAALLVATPQQHPKALGVKPGDRVLLVYPPGLDFIVAFLACLRAGVVAVPVYPPDPRKMKKDISMFVTVTKNSEASRALTTSTYYHVKQIAAIKQKLTFSDQLPWPDHLVWTATDDLVDVKNLESKQLWLSPTTSPRASDIAFLQYTSGSTSAPKGVVLTHGNLTHNLRTISSALVAGRDTVVVSWLPQYHDMGLIGAYLGTIFNGATGVYLSPFSFIRDPALWLRLIAKHRATHLQAPNFAYSLCARKGDRVETDGPVDLSSVRHMINGAEPIQGDAIDAFYRAFKRYGLADNVIKPTYGLAEHTVFVCSNGQQRVWVDKLALERDRQFVVSTDASCARKEMVGCGVPSRRDHGIDVRIVDPETRDECRDGQIGEVWIASASKALGYYGRDMAELSTDVFEATIRQRQDASSDESATTYVRTGDLGVLYHHELFICGRMKDLIIIRGRNHYPQDIEATAESHSELRPGCSAAFAYVDSSGDEQLALVAELRDAEIKHKASLCGTIRSAIAREHGVKATLLVLLKPRSIPKTTSGKISRARCKLALESQQLDVLYRNEDMIGDAPDDADEVADTVMDRGDARGVAPATKDKDAAAANGLPTVITDEVPERVYEFLLTELAQLLNTDVALVNPTRALQDLGMDSMALTQLQGIVAQKYRVHVPEEVLYHEATTLKSLHASLCGDASGAAALAASGRGDQQLIAGKKPKLFCGCIAC